MGKRRCMSAILLLFCILLCDLFCSVKCARQNVVEDIRIRFYNGKSVNESVILTLGNFTRILNLKKFRRNGKTMLYVHGYEESASSTSVKTVMSAYLRWRPDTNLILLDWANMATGSYMTNAAVNAEKVGRAAAYYLLDTMVLGLQSSRLHVVAHSLGCHVAASIAKTTQSSGVTLSRVTGLDCAFPMFYPVVTGVRLGPEAAVFVDAVHTDAKILGAPLSVGHADFWPNGGERIQPGCKEADYIRAPPFGSPAVEICSHSRSWRFYAESVRDPKAFVGVQCPDFTTFKRNRCSANSVAVMGYGTPPKTRGDFYLSTNDKFPFGRGTKGIKNL